MENSYLVILVTVPDIDIGKQISSKLLEEKLVACINLIGPIKSLYTWQGNINEDSEYLMICKTRSELFEKQLIPRIKELHPYEVPEIIALPITAGYTLYLNWITQVTTTTCK